eukprot:403360570
MENENQKGSKWDENLDLELKPHYQRKLYTIQTSPIVISGSSLIVTDTNFVLADGALSNSQYMITVDEATYTSGLEVKFTNCIFNISGNFLQTNKKLKITFDNCDFNVAKTNTLISIDYSNQDESGCFIQDLEGIFIIKNSILQDGDIANTSDSYLFNIKSLYGISFENVSFLNMNQNHQAVFNDYSCLNPLTEKQNIKIDSSKFINTNMQWTFYFNNIHNAQDQLYFSLIDNVFSNLNYKVKDLIIDQLHLTDIIMLEADLIIVKNPQKFQILNTFIEKILTQQTTYTCQFSGNTFQNYELYGFSDIETNQLDLISSKCLRSLATTQCSSSQYYDPVLMACTACPSGCETCASENQCTSCKIQSMIISPVNGMCECPSQQYLYSVGTPICRQCLSKCQTCNNEYKCLTYKTCPNSFQTLSSGQCTFQCQTGAHLNSTDCTTCSDTNCKLCNQVGASQHCAMCQNGYYLDLTTYTCVQSCPTKSKPISSTFVYGQNQNSVKYCRPFAGTTDYNYEYYVDPNSTSHIEFGTFEYPFKNLDPPVKEVFNFMYEKQTNYTVYHKRGTSMKMYYAIMPLTILNIQTYTLTDYGNQSLSKPMIYITNHEYLWPDSTQITIAETYYDYQTRLSRGEMETSEATKYFLKFSLFRGSLSLINIDIQSIMFGDEWINVLIFPYDGVNKTIIINNCYLDLDGAIMEVYTPLDTIMSYSHINVTNFENGFWNDFRWDCYQEGFEDVVGSMIFDSNLITGKHQQALYEFFFFSSMDDFIMINNTFDDFSFIDLETRPFLDLHPSSICDPTFRSQNIVFDSNKFINLYQSNIRFTIKYSNEFNGTKTFSFQNNEFINTQLNKDFMTMNIFNPSQIAVKNNYYKNVTVVKNQKVFNLLSIYSDISITNETIVNSTIDDLYTVAAAGTVTVKDLSFDNVQNTVAITESSSLLKISSALYLAQIEKFEIINSHFYYGKAFEVESAAVLDFKDSTCTNNIIENQDFFSFNQVKKATIQNLKFDNIQKISERARYILSMPTLILDQYAGSSHELKNITLSNSQSSFLSVQQVSVDSAQNADYEFKVNNCTLYNNTLTRKDSLIDFGEINYKNFNVLIDRLNILENKLELGNIYTLKMNCKQLLISNSMITKNRGKFASLKPASSDSINPLNFYLNNNKFQNNYAQADALIQLTTNSKLFTTNTEFLENYSVGRGSIVFSDYEKTYSYFQNCSFSKNYAYQGGVFYIQYQSEVVVSNCTIDQNFAVTGGVAYVINNGRLLLSNQTRLFNNSALNTCLIFLINTKLASMIENTDITQNDQANALINKNLFMSLNDTYKHIQKTYLDGIKLLSDKVQRTIQESSDSSVYAIKAKINLTNTNVHNNDLFLSASKESTVSLTNTSISDLSATGKLIQAVSSSIYLHNVTISGINHSTKTDENFYKISIVNKSLLKAAMCYFFNIWGSLIEVSGSSLIIEQSSQFKNITNDWRENSMIQIDTSNILMNDTSFKQLSSQYFSPIMSLQKDTLLALNTSFDGFDKTLFSLSGGNDYNFTTLDIKNGKMTYMPGQTEFIVNSIVFDANSVNLTLQNASITGIFTKFSSSVAYIENDPSSTSKAILNIENSSLINNSASINSGSIYAINVDVLINNTKFEGNSALNGDAGALFLDCEDSVINPCVYNISNTLFKNNSAYSNGGALKYTFYKPLLSNVTFTDNKAKYGGDQSSYPVQMQIKTGAQRRNLAMLSTQQAQALGITNGIVFEMETPLVSGSLITSSVSLILQDEYGKILNTDNSSAAVMNSILSEVQVMKSKSVQAVNGIFTFDDITTDSIVSAKITKAFPQFTQNKVYLKAKLRLCTRGEYQSTDNKCIICSDGFYTLKENQTQCSECPENAICADGFKITTSQGYWRKDVNQTEIFQCQTPEACLSGYETQCAKGYGGNLCQSCVKVDKKWYSRESANNCSECIDYSQNSWRLSGVTLLIVIYFIILISINIKTAGKQKITTVYMRILTNYFQILTLAQSFDLSWDDNLKQFLEVISFIGKSNEIILSIDCFVRDNGLSTHPAFIKMVIACVFPIIAIAVTFVFWTLWKLIRSASNFVTNLVTSLIIIIFICLPSITSITFAIFNCVEIFNDGESFLALDMSIQCWHDEHSYYAKSFGIPIIIIWVMGLPSLALFFLYRKRQNLQDIANLKRYGFLYLGLKEKSFYWEILLHFRKVFLICINVFFTTFKPLYRALIGFMLMIIYIETLEKIQPYATKEINDLEYKANIAAFLTFYGGLFFISDDLPFGVSVILFMLILLTNVYFWLSWIKLTFNNSYKKYLAKFFCFNSTSKGVEQESQKSKMKFDDVQMSDYGKDELFIKQKTLTPGKINSLKINLNDEESLNQQKNRKKSKTQVEKRGSSNSQSRKKGHKHRKGEVQLNESQRYMLENDLSSRDNEESIQLGYSNSVIKSKKSKKNSRNQDQVRDFQDPNSITISDKNSSEIKNKQANTKKSKSKKPKVSTSDNEETNSFTKTYPKIQEDKILQTIDSQNLNVPQQNLKTQNQFAIIKNQKTAISAALAFKNSPTYKGKIDKNEAITLQELEKQKSAINSKKMGQNLLNQQQSDQMSSSQISRSIKPNMDSFGQANSSSAKKDRSSSHNKERSISKNIDRSRSNKKAQNNDKIQNNDDIKTLRQLNQFNSDEEQTPSRVKPFNEKKQIGKKNKTTMNIQAQYQDEQPSHDYDDITQAQIHSVKYKQSQQHDGKQQSVKNKSRNNSKSAKKMTNTVRDQDKLFVKNQKQNQQAMAQTQIKDRNGSGSRKAKDLQLSDSSDQEESN